LVQQILLHSALFSFTKLEFSTPTLIMDSPGGSELFESYEQDYEAIKVSITERLNASGSQNGGNQHS
jgi:hypothetical protein